jgi:4-amino-4-deoxy-L-arabinose transferase-like glycosyltransferase
MRELIPAATQKRSGSELTLIVAWSAVALLVHLLTNGRYGYFRDELYYIACGQHLAFGYVDQPPLSILLLRLSEVVLGNSLFAIRLLPALGGAATVAITGLIARELGGRAGAVALACVGSLCALFNLAVGNFFSMNAFEPLFWMGCVYLLVRIINGASPTLWLWFGVLVGLGLENKHSTAFFAVGIFIALLLTPERRQFAEKWIWFGGLIAFAVALPNILWQLRNHWATYELLSNIARSDKNVALSPAQFIVQQIVFMNPGTLPLWLGGLIWLFGPRDGRRYIALGIIYLATLAEFIILHGKSYYLAPAYPMLFAAGGVAVERIFANRLKWFKSGLLALILARFSQINLAGKKWLRPSGMFIITCVPKISSALPSSAKTTAKPERSISLVPSSGCHRRFPDIRIIFCGDRVIGPAKLPWSWTRETTMSASNSFQLKTWAKS